MKNTNKANPAVSIRVTGFLKGWRKAHGLTQLQVAQRSGLSVDYITQLEGGRIQRPRRPTFEPLAKGYGVSLEVLLETFGLQVQQLDDEQLKAKLEWAFSCACKQPDLHFGSAMVSRSHDPVLMAAFVETYQRNEGRELLQPDEWSVIVAYVERTFLALPPASVRRIRKNG